ncbi:MAG: PAS domain-containing protein, partial [Gemmatimonadota bacterium]
PEKIDCAELEKEKFATPTLMRSIIDAVDIPILLINDKYEVKLMNHAAWKSLPIGGESGPLYCYRAFHDREIPCDGTAHPCPFEQVRKTLRPVTMLHEHVSGDKEKTLVEIIASPLFSEDGALTGIVESVRDITERVRAEEALKENEERYRLLVEHSGTAITLFNRDGVVLWMNTKGALNLGGAPDAFVGKSMHELFPERGHELLERNRRVFESGEGDYFEDAFELPAGKRWFSSSIRPIKETHGEPFAVQIISQEITDRKRAEEALQRLKDELEMRVMKRTAELHAANVKLRQEIAERKKAVGELRKSERKLTKQNVLFQEKNIALRELTGQLRVEKERIEGEVVANVDSLLLPLLTKLRKETSSLDSMYITLLEENVKQLISSFGNRISRKLHSLTPKEIEICNMIRSGLTSKEIARLKHSSHRTVERHRNNIRKKLGLSNKKINLTTYFKDLKTTRHLITRRFRTHYVHNLTILTTRVNLFNI